MPQEVKRLHLSARVDIPASESLKTMAKRLSLLAQGFKFEEEDTGRYEEVPAFEAETGDMYFVLLGIPEGETGQEYELKFRCSTDLPIRVLIANDGSSFLKSFLWEKPSPDGCIDFSEELAVALIQSGIAGCKPIRPWPGDGAL